MLILEEGNWFKCRERGSPSPFNYKNSSYFNYPAKHAFVNADSGFSRITWWFHRISINCIKQYFIFFPLSTFLAFQFH